MQHCTFLLCHFASDAPVVANANVFTNSTKYRTDVTKILQNKSGEEKFPRLRPKIFSKKKNP